jgi:hypothetical protein
MTNQGGWKRKWQWDKNHSQEKKICAEEASRRLSLQTSNFYSPPKFHKQLRITPKRMQPATNPNDLLQPGNMRTGPRPIPHHAGENRQDNDNSYSRIPDTDHAVGAREALVEQADRALHVVERSRGRGALLCDVACCEIHEEAALLVGWVGEDPAHPRGCADVVVYEVFDWVDDVAEEAED